MPIPALKYWNIFSGIANINSQYSYTILEKDTAILKNNSCTIKLISEGNNLFRVLIRSVNFVSENDQIQFSIQIRTQNEFSVNDVPEIMHYK